MTGSGQGVQPLRDAIGRNLRADETTWVRALLVEARSDATTLRRIETRACRLVAAVRERRRRAGGLDAFLHEYGLSSEEGVLLMCVAEALLRVPDDKTRESLIRDKFSGADWDRHVGHSPSLLVNASTWALMLTGRVMRLRDHPARPAGAAMRRLAARLGEPVVREAVSGAMRIMGRHYVLGRTIEEALANARPLEGRGYRFSYDMLGEAARTRDDAERYFRSYRQAIEAIGHAGTVCSVHAGPGISVKLSALHPRFELAQAARVRTELVPRVAELARAAAAAGIGMTIDAEEVERLEVALDVTEALATDPALTAWSGLGVVVQAYLKAAPQMLDWLADLAERLSRRLMVRLVKGAYWDAEIKRSQEQGLDGYPVFTRKASTDVSYLACSRRLLARPDLFYPQFATHNAHTAAAILEIAAGSRDFELQRLHGMGEVLHQELVEAERTGIPCRIYAPVGRHEDLLAYLVRRLLENGANSSFVNRLQDDRLPVAEIVADPINTVATLAQIPHPQIPLPRAIYLPERLNAHGIDLANRSALVDLAKQMAATEAGTWTAGPIVGSEERLEGARQVASPACRDRIIGRVADAGVQDVERAVAQAVAAASDWADLPVDARAACLERAAEQMEAEMPALMALAVREAGKTIPDALAEVREAADFCRYYAERARRDFAEPMLLPLAAGGSQGVRLKGGGVFACISPWNFPLAIFTGQVSAALVAGNAVLAKPAEQTPLMAAAAVRLLHRAGVPGSVLHLLPGPGEMVGAALVADARVSGVVFTGSTEVAQTINRTLSRRTGNLPVLIAETGGQNAMVVDSTALPEQVVRDVLAGAFQSAGQRCSALRVLFLQEDVADRILGMLAGAMEELAVGDPVLLSTDVGPVIDGDAQATLDTHIRRMQQDARLVGRATLGPGSGRGTFVAPVAFEIDRMSCLDREVFGPVLHVLRFAPDRLKDVVDAINATGYGLTLGIQTRIDATWRAIFERARAGNVYVNRNQIGAVVGVQPFGGQGRSGTGPKAGGPHYLHRFVAEYEPTPAAEEDGPSAAAVPRAPAVTFQRASLEAAIVATEAAGEDWARQPGAVRAAILERTADALAGDAGEVAQAAAHLRLYAGHIRTSLAAPQALPGPTGEQNEEWFQARGTIACLCAGVPSLATCVAQIAAAIGTGNTVIVWHPDWRLLRQVMHGFTEGGVPEGVIGILAEGDDGELADLLGVPSVAAASVSGPVGLALEVNWLLADRDGPIAPVIVHAGASAGGGIGLPSGDSPHYLERFVHERTLTINTTATGGNASLLTLGGEG